MEFETRMNSSKKKKSQRHIRNRKISSTSNKSFCVKPTSNVKLRISTLLENNKMLASSLEIARCELSDKQRLLDEYSGYAHNTMFARSKMLEMFSALKSFVKSFDEILLLLKWNDTNGLESRVTRRSYTNWTNMLEKLQESSKESMEADNQKTISTDNARDNVSEEGYALTEEYTSKSIQEPYASMTNISHDTVQPKLCKALTDDEGTGTPRLSPLKLLVNAEAFSNLKSNLFNNSSLSSTSNVSKTFANSSGSVCLQKPLSSKIPKLFCKSKRKKNNSDGKSYKSVKVSEKLDSKASCRKTFVKEPNPLINFELPVILNVNDSDLKVLSDENVSQISVESKVESINRNRKTFIVKPAESLEDSQSSLCDRRKTFVTKSDTAKAGTIKNKMDSEDLPPETNKDNVNEQFTPSNEFYVGSDQSNLKQNSCNKYSAIAEEASSSTIYTNEFSKSVLAEKDNLQGNAKSSIDSFENLQQDNASIVAKTKSDKIEENYTKIGNKKLSCGTKDLETVVCDIDIVSDNLLQFDNDIEELNKISDAMCVKDKKNLTDVFESSESEMEIPDFDLSSPEPLIKTAPIRGRISKSRPKKVFKFDVHEKNSVSYKKSVGSKSKIVIQNAEICQPNIELEKQSFKYSNNVNKKADTKQKKSANSLASHEASIGKCHDTHRKNKPVEILDDEKKIESEIKEQITMADLKTKDCITATSSANCVENEILDNFTVSNTNNPLLVSTDVQINCQTEKFNACTLSKELNTSLESPLSSQKEVCNFRTMKRMTDDLTHDTKLLSKKSKKNSGENFDETIHLHEEAGVIVSDITENVNNVRQKSVKTKKSMYKTKGKVKKTLTTKGSGKKNTFLVQAEIHPPPPSLNLSETDLDKENEDILPLKNVQVVLSDVFKTNDTVNEKTKRELVKRYKIKKNPLSSSSSNIELLEDGDKNAPCDESESEGLKARRRKKTMNYKEPSLNVKLRRN